MNLTCVHHARPYIIFYAIIFLYQWRTVSLTLVCRASHLHVKVTTGGLYAAFSCPLELLCSIDEDMMRFISAPPTIEHADCKYVLALARYDTPNEDIQFQIVRPHPDTQNYCLLYIAETLDKKQILVKFTRRYSCMRLCRTWTCTRHSRLWAPPRRLVCRCYGLHLAIDPALTCRGSYNVNRL